MNVVGLSSLSKEQELVQQWPKVNKAFLYFVSHVGVFSSEEESRRECELLYAWYRAYKDLAILLIDFYSLWYVLNGLFCDET